VSGVGRHYRSSELHENDRENPHGLLRYGVSADIGVRHSTGENETVTLQQYLK